MLRLEKYPPKDFLLTDTESNESIIVPFDIAIGIKKLCRTGGDLVQRLYSIYEGNKKWEQILDNNLAPDCVNKSTNIIQLLEDFERKVQKN